MRFYRVAVKDDSPHWSYVRTEAHNEAKCRLQLGADRTELRVELVEVALTQENVEDVLNGKEPLYTTLRTWALTARGALAEVQPGE